MSVWIPERWDAGQWDHAHWDGQLGFNAGAGAVVLNSTAATLRIHRTMGALAPGAIVITGVPVTLVWARSVATAPGAIILTGHDAGLTLARRLTLLPGAIVLTGNAAGLIYTPAGAVDLVLPASPGAIVLAGSDAGLYPTVAPVPMPPPGVMQFGQRVFLKRW